MEHLAKVVVIGSTGVGKSALLLRYVDNDFYDSYISTIGVDFKIKTLTSSGGKLLRLQLWDTGGQERFRSIVSSYYRGAHAILLVYDITNYESFTDLATWLAEIQKYNTSAPLIYVIGNKIDLEKRRVVPVKKAQEFCKSHDFKHVEVSAKSGDNVDAIFEEIGTAILARYNSIIEVRPVTVALQRTAIPPKESCRC